nr:probable receptor-like protein kinase At5g47070 isoform X2 [Tanacetum cinerariifolium]
MTFDSRSTEDVLPWPGNVNIEFDSRSMKDVLPWSGNANMAFDSRSTKDVLPWPGNVNMAFDLRSTKDVIPLLNNHNGMATRMKERISAAFEARRMCHGGRTEDTKKENMSGRAEYRERTGPITTDTKKENMTGHAECHERTEPMTADTKKENMSGRVEYRGRTGHMTADTKKENMSEHAEHHGRTEPMTADTKKENMFGRAERHGRTGPMTTDTKKENMSRQRHGRTADTKKESMSGRAEYRGRTGPVTADTKKENMTGHAERHGRTERSTRVHVLGDCAQMLGFPWLDDFPDVAPQILHLKRFTYRELNEATNSFSESSKIAEGEYGPIYMAVFEDSHINVNLVVKRLKERLVTGKKEWATEVNYVWIGEHPNLVKLVGYCSEGNERGLQRLLVYEYMPNKSVEYHLSTRSQIPLLWTMRLNLALDVARGLAHLHEHK